MVAKVIKQSAQATSSKSPQLALPFDVLPLEPMTVRIPTAIQLTGIGRSKLYQLIGAGDIETVKVGASTLIMLASLRHFIETRRV
jgi:hypothetical protein